MDREWAERSRDERRAKLSEASEHGKAKLLYEYDFGDSWQLRLTVVSTSGPEAGTRYPVGLAGERAAPPEDCGGIPGYYGFLEAIADPSHEEHADMVEWIGGEFDADAFDLAGINRALRSVR